MATLGGSTIQNGLDLLLVNPSMDWERDRQEQIVKRLEETIPNQETPHIGIAYMLAVAKRDGIKARYLDMVMDAITVEDLIRCIQRTKPSLVGFTAFTVQIRTAAAIAERYGEGMLEKMKTLGWKFGIGVNEKAVS